MPAAGLSRDRGVRASGSPVLRRAKVYAVANQKGGVGKTTTAVNVSACLAEAGERVLLIDLDPQANATSGLGMRANGASTYDLLDGDRDRKSTRLNSSHRLLSRMPSSA